jgi:hypothetical protein
MIYNNAINIEMDMNNAIRDRNNKKDKVSRSFIIAKENAGFIEKYLEKIYNLIITTSINPEYLNMQIYWNRDRITRYKN